MKRKFCQLSDNSMSKYQKVSLDRDLRLMKFQVPLKEYIRNIEHQDRWLMRAIKASNQ